MKNLVISPAIEGKLILKHQLSRKDVEQCFINNAKFHNWNTGRTEVPQLAIPIIEKIAKEHGLEF
jgi:hypothetical protein